MSEKIRRLTFQVPIGVQARSYPACYRIAIWTDIAVINQVDLLISFIFICSSLDFRIPYFCLFQFTFPKEAAKVNLNSADDPASVSQILSGSHPVEQDK